MKLSSLNRARIPQSSGIYMFKGARGKVLYIGKATFLKTRLRSYFSPDISAKRGEGGGKVVARGTPEEIVERKESYTAKYLKKHL